MALTIGKKLDYAQLAKQQLSAPDAKKPSASVFPVPTPAPYKNADGVITIPTIVPTVAPVIKQKSGFDTIKNIVSKAFGF